jgi:hypothetical protein
MGFSIRSSPRTYIKDSFLNVTIVLNNYKMIGKCEI